MKKIRIIIGFLMVFNIAVVLGLSTFNYFIVKAEDTYMPELNVLPDTTNNMMKLSWNKDYTGTYHYMVCQEDSKASDTYQTIPLKKTISVLNVYPNSSNNPDCDEASCAKWMAAYGSPSGTDYTMKFENIDLTDFNNNCKQYLYTNGINGSYKYDVLYFGCADSNNGMDLSTDARSAVETFIKYGGGCLLGHDTASNDHTNFITLAKNYLNMEVQMKNEAYAPYGDDHVVVSKKGLLMNYPYNLGSVNTVLSTPMSHSYYEMAMGDVWFKYLQNDYNTSAPDEKTSVSGGRTGTNNFYLTTWNNVAMIQTGHQITSTTTDEQKILANTLYYLAQISTGNSAEDHMSQDLAKPDAVKGSITADTAPDGKVTVKWDSSIDQGSSYDYKLRALDSTGTYKDSAEKTATITTGIAGYAVVIDQNSSNNIDVGTTVTTNTNSIVKSNLAPGTYYAHIKAIDGANNISDEYTTSFEVSLPAPVITPGEGNIEKGDKVILSCNVSDAVIYYTTDNSTPTTSSQKYSGAIEVNNSETVKAYAVKADYKDSVVASASFTVNTHKLSYDVNGGTGSAPSETSYFKGDRATLATINNLSKDNNLCIGWNTDSNGAGTSYKPGTEFTIDTADVKLYAQWITPSITINGTAQAGKMLSATVNPGDAVVSYQWKADGENVGTDSALYTVQPSDIGKKITLTITGKDNCSGTFTSSAVDAVNSAPVLTDNAVALTAINEDDTASTGTKVSDMLSGRASDADTSNNLGIAVTFADSTNGTWQYYSGGSWWPLSPKEDPVSETSAMLLNKDTMIAFRPGADYNGTATIKFKVWDGTTGSHAERANVSTASGGSSAFSLETGIATITVNSVNDAPQILKKSGNNMLHFDGSNDYVSVNSIDLNGSFTVEGWINAEAANTYSRVFDFGNGSNNNNLWLGFNGNNGNMEFEVWNGTDRKDAFGVCSKDLVPLNKWIYVTAVYNQSEQMGYIYWNGEIVAHGMMDLTHTGTIIRDHNYFGQSNWYMNDSYFKGSMKDLSVWNDCRTASEILKDMNTSLIGTEDNLVLYYPLDDAVSSSSVRSVTGNSYNGILNNGLTLTNIGTFDYQLSGFSGDDIAVDQLYLKDDNADEDLSLSVSNGTLRFGTTEGLTFENGSQASKNLTVHGSITDINNALATLKYCSDKDFSGTDTVNVGVSDGALTASKSITMKIINVSPKISLQPVNCNVKEGDTAVFSVTASVPDGKKISYQWQISTDQGKSWNDVVGEKGASITVKNINSSNNGSMYQCNVTNSDDNKSVVSTSALLSVIPVINGVVKNASSNAVSGAAITFTNKEDSSKSYSAMTDANGAYNLANVADGNYIMKVVTDDGIESYINDISILNGHFTSDTKKTVTLPPAPVTAVTLTEKNTGNDKIDGQNFMIGFADSTDDASVAYYKVYLYQDGKQPADYNAFYNISGENTAVKTITRTADMDGSASELGAGITADSLGLPLNCGDYWAVIIAEDKFGNYSFAEIPQKTTMKIYLNSVAVIGKTKVGETLSAEVNPSAATVSYQWKSNGVNVGSTSTYQVKKSDLGHKITVTITGTGLYSGALTSTETDVIKDASYIIAGTVKDSESKAVSGAAITLTDKSDPSKTYVGITDGTGNYQIPAVPDGSYSIKVEKEGKTIGSSSVSVAGSDITAESGEGNITVSKPTFNVAGTVKDSESKAVSGATITLTDKSDPSKTYVGITDGTGNYQIPAVPDGSYSIKVEKEGKTIGSSSVSVAGSDITAESGEGNITVSKPTFNVAGTVKDSESKAVSGATITLTDKSDPSKTYVGITDGTGSYQIPGVPDGSYSIKVEKEGKTIGTSSVSVAGSDITAESGKGNITVSKPTFIIAGTVKDSDSKAVSGATITLTDKSDPSKTYVGITDGTGSYQIPGVPDGSYSIKVEKEGKTIGTSSVSVAGSDITAESGKGNITVSKPTFIIAGTVKDSDSKAVSGAAIILTDTSDPSKTYVGITDGNGNYQIPGVPDGSYSIKVEKEGKTLGTSSVSVAGSDITAGSGKGNITVSKPTFIIAGTVKDSGNKAVSGATITLTDTSDPSKTYVGITDENGNYNIPGVPDGSYSIKVEKEGKTIGTSSVSVAGSDITAESGKGNITVPVTPVIPPVQPTYNVIGTIKDSESKAVSGAAITLTDTSDPSKTYVGITDNNGNYQIPGVPDGSYSIKVEKEGKTIGTSSVSVAGSDITAESGKGNITVPVTPVIPPVQPTYNVIGTIKDSESKAVSGAAITLTDTSDPSKTYVGITDNNGNYQIPGVPDGSYSIKVEKEGKTIGTSSVSVAGSDITAESGKGNITVPVTPVIPPVQPTYNVIGTIKDSESKAVSGAAITLTDTSDPSKTYVGITDNNGNYQIPGVPDGSYSIKVEKEGKTIGTSSVSVAGSDITAESGKGNITVPVTPVIPPVQPTYNVIGTIKDSESKAVSGAAITLTDTSDPSKTYVGITDNNGNYQIPGVPDGSYSIKVEKEGKTIGTSSVSVAGSDITAESGKGNITVPVTPVIPPVQPTYNVIGTIKDSESKAVSGAAITLTDTSDPSKTYVGITDNNGNYQIPGVPDGSYSIKVEKEGKTIGTSSVSVAGSDITAESGKGNITVPVTPVIPPVQPTYNVIGTIKDSESKAVSGAAITLTDTSDPSKTYVGITDNNGNYQIPGVPDGSYSIKVEKEGKTIGTSSVSIAGSDITAESGKGNITVPITSVPVPTQIIPATKDTGEKTEEVTVDVKMGETDENASIIPIVRTTKEDGNKTDTVVFSEEKAKETIENLKKEEKNAARIVIPDKNDEVSETKVTIPSATLGVLKESNIDFAVETENAKINIPKESLQNAEIKSSDDLYFRLVPIKNEAEKQDIIKRAEQEPVVKTVINDSSATVVGRPMEIETNMSSVPIDIILPLTDVQIPADEKAKEAFLNELGVYIEHSDGDKEFIKGTIVPYKDGVLGIQFKITKFSTFTIIKVDSTQVKKQKTANKAATKKVILIATSADFADAYAGEVLAEKLGGKVITFGYTEKEVHRIMSYITKNLTVKDKIYILGLGKAVKTDVEKLLRKRGYKKVIRIGGADKYETAQKISQYINVKKGTKAVLVNGNKLPKNGNRIRNLCTKNGYPILYVKADSLTKYTIKALKRIKPLKVYLAGDRKQISNKIVKELIKKLGIRYENIIRITK